VRRITAIEGKPSANCPNSTFTYCNRGLVKTRTDNKGNVTTTWHPPLFLPATVTEPDCITTYSYDDHSVRLSRRNESKRILVDACTNAFEEF